MEDLLKFKELLEYYLELTNKMIDSNDLCLNEDDDEEYLDLPLMVGDLLEDLKIKEY